MKRFPVKRKTDTNSNGCQQGNQEGRQENCSLEQREQFALFLRHCWFVSCFTRVLSRSVHKKWENEFRNIS